MIGIKFDQQIKKKPKTPKFWTVFFKARFFQSHFPALLKVTILNKQLLLIPIQHYVLVVLISFS